MYKVILPDQRAGCLHRLWKAIVMGPVGEQGSTAIADPEQLRSAASPHNRQEEEWLEGIREMDE